MRIQKLLLAVFALCVASVCFAGSPRYPYYYNARWYPATTKVTRYSYTYYYYAPKRYHHVYVYPAVSTRYVYYYNWEKQQYWGRFDYESEKYSLLPEDKRKAKLEDIAEKDFPAPVALDKVVIPGTDIKMIAPPPLPNETQPPRDPKDPGLIPPKK